MTATAFVMAECELCAAAEALYAADGQPRVCDCGAVYADDGFVWPEGERASHVGLTLPPVRALARAIEEVGLALRVGSDDRKGNVVREFRTTHPIARVMAERRGATTDATSADVLKLAYAIANGTSRHAADARRCFVDSLVRYCDETSSPSDLPSTDYDHAAARKHAARLAALPQDVRRPLVAVANGGASQGWPQAVARVESECFPAPASTTYGEAGRPKRDRSQPTEAMVRTAQAEALLTAALTAWCEP